MPFETVPYALPLHSENWMQERAEGLLAELRTRRSCRSFSDRPVPRDVVQQLIAVANTAPSGANRQPWCFVAVDDPVIKREIREAAEAEEHENYHRRMPPEWLAALEPIGTDEHKPFLKMAPWLIVIFRIDWEMHQGRKIKSYYPVESVGLAAGMFIVACHLVGLATLTHTPSPMRFLRKILRRGENERPFLLIPIGYPSDECTVPKLAKKNVSEVLQWNR